MGRSSTTEKIGVSQIGFVVVVAVIFCFKSFCSTVEGFQLDLTLRLQAVWQDFLAVEIEGMIIMLHDGSLGLSTF